MSKKVLNKDLAGRFSQLAEALGETPNSMGGERYRLATKGTVPGIDLVQKIKERHPDIDANWLVTGIGEMFINPSSSSSTAPSSELSSESKATIEEKMIAMSTAIINLTNELFALRKDVESLRSRDRVIRSAS